MAENLGLPGEAAATPVFVDASGRRGRVIRRVAAILLWVCVAYALVLLIAAFTGVPIQGAVVPYPAIGQGGHPAHQPASGPPVAGTGPITSPSTSGAAVTPTTAAATVTRAHPSAVKGSKAKHSAAASTMAPTPTTATSPTTAPTSTPPGASHRPTKSPTVNPHGHTIGPKK